MFRPSFLTLALLFIFQAATAKRDYDDQVYNVCAINWQPVITCSKNGSAAGLNQLEVDRIAERLRWIRLDEDGPKLNGTTYYRYRCMSLEEMLEDLSGPKGICHLGISLTVSKHRIKNGMTFSFPIYRGNLAVLKNPKYTSRDGWGFTRPVTISVWVTVLVTGGALVPFLLMLFDYISEQEKIPRSLSDLSNGMSTAMWKSMTTLLRLGGESIRSAEAKVVMTGYAFLVLIIVTVYTANMTANLTLRKIRKVESINELRGATVGAMSVYRPRLDGEVKKVHELQVNENTMDDAWDLLQSGTVDALVVASEWIARVLATRGCRDDLYMFNLRLEPFDYALPFPASVPTNILNKVNRAIIELSEHFELQQIADAYGSENKCTGHNIDPLTVLGMWQVYGVWVVMAGCILLASLISVARCIMKRYQVRMAFIQFEGEERDIEMMPVPPAEQHAEASRRARVEYAVMGEFQREMRDLKAELSRAKKRRPRWRPRRYRRSPVVATPRQ